MIKAIHFSVRRASGHALVAWLGMSAPALAQADMVGMWSGTVAQNEGSSGYSVVMTITATSAMTDYPDLKCGGTLSRVGSAGGYVFYTETITRGRLDQGGRCIDGTITIAAAQGKLAWGWFGAFKGKALNGHALLTRR